MEESNDVDVTRVAFFENLDVFEETAVYPLKSANKSYGLQGNPKIKEPGYDPSARFRIAKT